jgi:hypothetical protein
MTESPNDSVLAESGKTEVRDMRFVVDQSGKDFKNRVFVRLVAKKRRFSKVNFSYCTFDACYLRDCTFDSCNFTGCRFVASNLHGSTFEGCTFDYATFERTEIDSYIVLSECPLEENLKLRFARSLRMNFQQLGDAKAVNRAISVEIKATEVHLWKASFSKETYYRKKYKGLKRFEQVIEYGLFKVLDLIWGNGESPWKLIRAVAFILLCIGLADAIFFHDPNSIRDYAVGIGRSIQIFMGTFSPPNYPAWYVSLILAIRLVIFAFFTAIVIKRISRR